MGFPVIVTLVVCAYNNSQKQKLTAAVLILRVLRSVGNGLADFSQKLSMAMSAVLVRERITLKAMLGIVLAFVGLIAMNVL